MIVGAALPVLAENAITTLFERTINDTRIFWEQHSDGSVRCREWEWCCPEIPAILAGMDAVVFVTREPSSVRVAASDLLVIALEGRRLWGKWRVLRRPPRGRVAVTWDDRSEVDV
jgi:hypothetical protein